MLGEQVAGQVGRRLLGITHDHGASMQIEVESRHRLQAAARPSLKQQVLAVDGPAHRRWAQLMHRQSETL